MQSSCSYFLLELALLARRQTSVVTTFHGRNCSCAQAVNWLQPHTRRRGSVPCKSAPEAVCFPPAHTVSISSACLISCSWLKVDCVWSSIRPYEPAQQDQESTGRTRVRAGTTHSAKTIWKHNMLQPTEKKSYVCSVVWRSLH